MDFTTKAPVIGPVSGVRISSIIPNGATVSWNAHGSVTGAGYKLELKGNTIWTYTDSAPPKKFYLLSSDTLYEVRVDLKNVAGTWSAWTEFTTKSPDPCSSSTIESGERLREYMSMTLDAYNDRVRGLYVEQNDFETDAWVSVHAVSALVVAKAKMVGTYDPATDAEGLYSEWVVDTHDTPSRLAEINEALNMTAPAKRINNIHSTNVQAANAGHAPFNLEFSDAEYWMDATLQLRCGLVDDTCGITSGTDMPPEKNDPAPDLARDPAPLYLVLKVKADSKAPRIYGLGDTGEVPLSGIGGFGSCKAGYTATTTNLAEDGFLSHYTKSSGKLTIPEGCSKSSSGYKSATISCTKEFTGYKYIAAEATGTAAFWWN